MSGAVTYPPTGAILLPRHASLHAFLCIFQCRILGSVLTCTSAPVQAVPTVLGATWGMIWTTLVLPRYSSDKMLALQAACLRGVFEAASWCEPWAGMWLCIVASAQPLVSPPSALCSMYGEVLQAASERRQPKLGPQLAALERSAGQVAGVAALLGTSSIDPRLMPFAGQLLPTPPVVRLVQPRLKALGSALLASVSTVAKVAWKPLPSGNAKTAAAAVTGVALHSESSLAAGEYFRIATTEGPGMKASMDAVMAAHAELVEAIAGEGWRGAGALP